jgi:hypothetical protein
MIAWIIPVLIVAFGILAVLDFVARELLNAIIDCELVLLLVVIAICGGLS